MSHAKTAIYKNKTFEYVGGYALLSTACLHKDNRLKSDLTISK